MSSRYLFKFQISHPSLYCCLLLTTTKVSVDSKNLKNIDRTNKTKTLRIRISVHQQPFSSEITIKNKYLVKYKLRLKLFMLQPVLAGLQINPSTSLCFRFTETHLLRSLRSRRSSRGRRRTRLYRSVDSPTPRTCKIKLPKPRIRRTVMWGESDEYLGNPANFSPRPSRLRLTTGFV